MSREVTCPLCEREVRAINTSRSGINLGTTMVFYIHDDGEAHWTAIVDNQDCPDLPEEAITGS